MRKIAGMDKEAVREAFASFSNSQRLNQHQMVFLEKLINYISANGYVKTQEVFNNAPFDKPRPIQEMFEMPQIIELFSIIETFKENARAESALG